jgi:hypothetical protein
MPFDPQSPSTALPASANTAPQPPNAQPAAPSFLEAHAWQTAHRAWLPYWQQQDPVPPAPEAAPEIETPGEVLTERQEAFCRL